MKKSRFLSFALIVLTGVFTASMSACKDDLQSSQDDSVECTESWYEEKSGYKFCGYFEDEAFTKRVNKIVTQETAAQYYAKYQVDKVQMLDCASIDFERVIYAADFYDAARFYLKEIYSEEVFYMEENGMLPDYSPLGLPLTVEEMYNGEGKGFYTIRDTSDGIKDGYKDNYIYSQDVKVRTCKRDNTWRVYIGDEEEYTEDGWEYFIADNAFAVITGYKGEDTTSLSIPSEIEGYPVKIISMYLSIFRMDPMGATPFPSVDELNIPSSVRDVTILGGFSANCIKKLNIAEGVEQVRIHALLSSNITIPSTAYFVDIHQESIVGQNNYMMAQSIKVNGGEHYYTKDGCLYSKEGDLCYQFGEQDKLNLYVDTGTKRVMPFAFTGANKNYWLPDSLEYFDWLCFEKTLRKLGVLGLNYSLMPVVWINSEKVARTAFEEGLFWSAPCFMINNSIASRAFFDKSKETLLELEDVVAEADWTELIDGILSKDFQGYRAVRADLLRMENQYIYSQIYNGLENGQEGVLTYLGGELPDSEFIDYIQERWYEYLHMDEE